MGGGVAGGLAQRECGVAAGREVAVHVEHRRKVEGRIELPSGPRFMGRLSGVLPGVLPGWLPGVLLGKLPGRLPGVLPLAATLTTGKQASLNRSWHNVLCVGDGGNRTHAVQVRM